MIMSKGYVILLGLIVVIFGINYGINNRITYERQEAAVCAMHAERRGNSIDGCW